MNKLQILEKIVSEGQYMKVKVNINGKNKKIDIDGFTANAMLKVARALNDVNRNKFFALDWLKMATVTWKLLK